MVFVICVMRLGALSSNLSAQSATAPLETTRQSPGAKPGTGSHGSSQTTMERLQAQKQIDEALSSIALGMPGRNEVVKNRPFSAEAVTETVDISQDGQRTKRRNVTKIDRDREGRTRREQTIEAIAPSLPISPRKIIFIFDPVGGSSYVIDPKEQVTREFMAYSNGSQDHGSHDAGSKASTSVAVEPLGQRQFGGLLCSGIRKTSMPSRQEKDTKMIGGATTETWSSVDLGVIVDSLTQDPRFGTVHYFLRGVSLRDPSPQLFVPPLHYKMEHPRNAN
jgi:hypothetical protein